jgi:hypothetical protein
MFGAALENERKQFLPFFLGCGSEAAIEQLHIHLKLTHLI